MPEVEDFPTDDALRFGKLRTVFLSFAAFGLVVLVVPFTPRVYENFINIFLIKINFKQHMNKNMHIIKKNLQNYKNAV